MSAVLSRKIFHSTLPGKSLNEITFQLTSSIFHCDRTCSSTWKDLVFLPGLKPLSENPALWSIEARGTETIPQVEFSEVQAEFSSSRVLIKFQAISVHNSTYNSAETVTHPSGRSNLLLNDLIYFGT